MTAPIVSHVRAWAVLCAVDWPAGAASKWPAKGRLAQPQGANRPAELVVTLATGGQLEAATEAQQILRGLGHRWSMLLRVARVPDLENRAAELAAEWLERAAHDSRFIRDQEDYGAGSPGEFPFPFRKGGDNGGS